jgi:hypothetical protein
MDTVNKYSSLNIAETTACHFVHVNPDRDFGRKTNFRKAPSVTYNKRKEGCTLFTIGKYIQSQSRRKQTDVFDGVAAAAGVPDTCAFVFTINVNRGRQCVP